ncbi:hypothetical protein C8F01DRAFT_1144979 [Mycena amicta]|nr:hypothetical protein C8F01DRAFT_1144979 [Mycena amicta]
MGANEPRFPPELECDIFEFTARVHPETIPSLLLVAQRVHIWIEPFLYRTVRVEMYDQLLRITQTKPAAASFLASAVRHALLNEYHPRMVDILQLCTGITHLAITSDARYASELRPLLPVLRLHCLAVQLVILFPRRLFPTMDAAQETFSTLTHLDIFDPVEDNHLCHHSSVATVSGIARRTLAFLTSLPALTHLSYNLELSAGTLLRVLVRLTKEAESARNLARHLLFKDDVRLVVCLFTEWYDAVLDGRNYWDVAEEFVTRKGAGEIPADVFFARDERKPEEDSEDVPEGSAESAEEFESSPEST